MPYPIEQVDPAITRPLRQRLLRREQTLDELIVPGEDDPEGGWFAAFDGDEVVGTAGVFPEDRPGARPGGWRLRAMSALRQREGTGSALLDACIEHAVAGGGSYLWCSARVPARGFYERHGFVTVTDVYEPYGLGPHVDMVRDPIT